MLLGTQNRRWRMARSRSLANGGRLTDVGCKHEETSHGLSNAMFSASALIIEP
jgi:hypothetical protein